MPSPLWAGVPSHRQGSLNLLLLLPLGTPGVQPTLNPHLPQLLTTLQSHWAFLRSHEPFPTQASAQTAPSTQNLEHSVPCSESLSSWGISSILPCNTPCVVLVPYFSDADP